MAINFLNNSVFAGNIIASSSSAVIQTPRISMEADGTLDWGQVRDYGTLTWDTGYAVMKGQSGKGLKFQVNNNSTALTIDTSDNSTFTGNIATATSKRISVGTWDNSSFTGSSAQGFSVQGATPGLFILETGLTNKKSYLAMSGGAMYLGGSIDFLALDTDGDRALTLDNAQNATFAGDIIMANAKILYTDDIRASTGGMIIGPTGSSTLTLRTGGTARLTINSGGLAVFNSTPEVGTRSAGDNTTRAASTAFVTAAVAAVPIGDYLPLAGGTMTGDLKLNDNVDLYLGTGNDFQAYHDGSNTYLRNLNGNFVIKQDKVDADLILESDDGSGNTTPYFQLDGSHTQSIAWKDIHFVDGIKAKFGDYASPDLQIYHDGSDSYIEESGTGRLILSGGSDIQLQSPAGELMGDFNGNGSVDLYYNNSKKFETTNIGVQVTGAMSATTVGMTNIVTNRIVKFNGSVLDDSTMTDDGTNVTMTGDFTVQGGDITLGGTGRIQGIDTVSANTDAANKAYVDTTAAGESTWPNVGAGSRANYNLGFTQTASQGGYAGFYFEKTAGASDAGYFLLRGGGDTGVYKQGGITLVGDAGTLTIATRTSASNVIRFMTGASSVERLNITGTGAFSFGSSVTNYGTSGQVMTSNGNATPGWTTINTGVLSVSDDGGNTINVSGSSTARVVSAITGTVSINSANLATGAQIQTAINDAVTGVLKYEGVWNANTNSPSLSSGSGTVGEYYIVSVAGSTNLDGITDWAVGDWAVFSDQATDAWQKIDNTQVGNVTGSGSSGRVAYWNSNSNITSDADLTFDGSNLTVGGNLTVTGNQYFNGQFIEGDGKEMFRYSDGWLRINEDNDFGSGIYCGTGILRTDGEFQVGGSGQYAKITSVGAATFATLATGGTLTVSGNTTLSGTTNTISGNTLFGGYTRLGGRLVNQYIASLSASGQQARQYEIARAFMDYNDWNNTGVIKINLMEEYFDEGIGKEYAIRWGYNNTVDIDLINIYGGGDNANGFECVLGTLTQIGTSDIYYLPIIVKLRYYARVGALVTTNRSLTTNATSTSGGVIYINPSPTAVNISNFSVVDSVEFSGPADNINLGTASTKVGIGFADATLPTQALDVNANMRLRGRLYDVNNNQGGSGDVLVSTGSGVDWVSASTPGTGTFLPLAGGTMTGKAVFPSAIASRPQLPGGFIAIDTGDADVDIWGISRDYYPSNPTTANAWGLKWGSSPNQFQWVGAGVNRITFDLDQGNIVTLGNITAPRIGIGAVNASYNLYNNGTTYLNGATIVDAAFTQSGGDASTFSGNVTVGANTVQNGANPGLKIQSTNTSQTVLGLHNTTSRNWEVAVGGSGSSVGAGTWYVYDNTANDARLKIDTSGNATFAGNVTADNFYGLAQDLAVTSNDTFSGTYGLLWHAGADVYSSTWMTVNGSNDTLTVPTIAADLNGTINTATTGVTQTAGNNSTLIATTAYADAAAAAIPIGNYLPLAGGTLTGGLVGLYAKFTQGVYDDSSGIRIVNPGGGSRTTQTSSTTGAIKITLPVSWTNTMARMTIKVYEYTTNESFTLVCGGYNHSSQAWINEFAYIESSGYKDRNFTVRMGHDGTKCCIYIGELTSTWTYTQVFVTDVQLGYSGLSASNWRSGWVIDFEASAFGTITYTETNPQINNWGRNGSNISYTSGSGNVLVTTQSANDNSTKAASTAYVDNAVASGPQGTITGGGQNLRLALWDGSSSIGSDGDFTYNGDTIFTTKLSVQNQINTNSANLEINYANGDGTTTNFKNLDIRNGKNDIITSFEGSTKNVTNRGNNFLIGGNFANNSYNSTSGARLLFGGGNSDSLSNYYIGTNLNNYGGNYTKLDLAWHTGIRIGAQSQYGGVRIYNNEDFSTVLFSVGTGNTDVAVTNSLTVGAAIRTNSYQDFSGNILFLAGNTTTGASRSLNLRNSGSTSDPSSSDDSLSTGITWGQRSDSTPYYMIYPNLENWNSSGNYSKLTLAWHTGIKIGADSGYGGTRFYNQSPDVSGAAVILNVGVGNSNIGVVNNLTVGGQATGPAPTTTTSYANKNYVDTLAATKTPLNDIRSLGAPAFTNGTNPNITTAQVMAEIEADGGFDSYSSVFKTTWSYAGNYNLTDAGDFTETAGSSWITWTDNSSDSTRGNITALAIAPTTGASAGGVFIYNDQGSGYNAGWRQVWTNTTDGAGSGLDADLLDGQQGSYYLDYANFTGTPTIPSVGNGTLTVQGTGVLGGSGTFTANQSGDSIISVTHDNSGVTAGSYTNANITVNASGHITAAANGSDAQGVTSVATGGGLDGGTITTTGTIEVEYDGVPTNIIQSGFNFTGDTVVPGDYMMISDPGQTTTNRRIGYVTVGDLPKAPQTTFTRTINASTYTMLCTVEGDRLASIVDLTITGTSNGVVLAASFEIIVNHYQDIHVRSMGGDYLNTTIRITSNNNEDYSIEAKAGGGSNTEVEVCVFPRANEIINPTTTDPGYTGEEYVHTAIEGWRFGGEDSNTTSARVAINGALAIGTTFPTKPLTVNGTIRAEDNNSGDYIDITNDGSVSGHSKIETSNGNLIVDPAGILDVQANAVVKTSNGVGDFYIGNYATAKHFRFHTNNSQTYFDMNCSTINWREGSSTRYYFYPSTANMTINGTLTQNSDSRVKENVVEIDDCIGKVQAMKGVYYNRTDFNTDVTKVGVIAQDVEAVLPELILEAPDTGLKSVAYAELTAVLINAIKEQQEIIDDLKTRVQQLEK